MLYLLHGARGNELSWIQKGNILHNIDSLIASSKMKETIVVFPNVNQYKSEKDYGKSRLKGAIESFFETDGVVEAAFMNDVVKTVDSLYRTIPDHFHSDRTLIAGVVLYSSKMTPSAKHSETIEENIAKSYIFASL